MKNLKSDDFKWFADSSGEWLCIRCKNPAGELEKIISGKVYDVQIKQHRERRSLDANAYCWVLLDKLSEKLSSSRTPMTKETLYRQLIPDVGGVSQTVCVKSEAADKLVEGWEHNGLGWIAELMPSKIGGCTNVILYYGSSTYDTAQMSRLINLVVDECKAQDIETMTPKELERLEGYGLEK